MLKMSLLCGNCQQESESLTSSMWTESTVCPKCERLGFLMFLRHKKEPVYQEAVEPNCEHEWADVGFFFCTEVPLYPQQCVKCGWHRMESRPTPLALDTATPSEAGESGLS